MSSLVYGLDTCVRRSFWESVQEDALFLLWNILCILISKRELCFLFVVLECLYLIHLGGAGRGGVRKKIRSGVKVGTCVRVCACVTAVNRIKDGDKTAQVCVCVRTVAYATAVTRPALSFRQYLPQTCIQQISVCQSHECTKSALACLN